MSKYSVLWEYVHNSEKQLIILSFHDIKEIIGFEIDHSFLNYKKELQNYGYEVGKISLKSKTITFRKKE